MNINQEVFIPPELRPNVTQQLYSSTNGADSALMECEGCIYASGSTAESRKSKDMKEGKEGKDIKDGKEGKETKEGKEGKDTAQ